MKPNLRFGYRQVTLGAEQQAFVAEPEKALLDPVYLHPGGDDSAYLKELRLNFDALRLNRVEAFARECGAPKLLRAAKRICKLAREIPEYETL